MSEDHRKEQGCYMAGGREPQRVSESWGWGGAHKERIKPSRGQEGGMLATPLGGKENKLEV